MSKRQRQARLSRYFDTSKARPRTHLPRQPFDSDYVGSGCTQGKGPTKLSERLYEHYCEGREGSGWKHKIYVCCPRCALADSKIRIAPHFNTQELLAYIEANLILQRNIRAADYENYEMDYEKLERKIEGLQQEIDHFHHLDDMRARDKANKRKREN
jgi:hypothetical protein